MKRKAFTLYAVLVLILVTGCVGENETREETGAEELTAPTERTEIIEETTVGPEASTSENSQQGWVT
jgi:hypothetical protein